MIKNKIQYWLLKSEPETYSIEDLKKDKTTFWDGVRNYQARNFLRDSLRVGDLAFFYHSNAEPPGIAGIVQVVKKGEPDDTQFDSQDVHYDPKAKPEHPIWYGVEVKFVEKFPALLSLETLRKIKSLSSMMLLKKGQRLSVQPVTETEWKTILGMKDSH